MTSAAFELAILTVQRLQAHQLDRTLSGIAAIQLLDIIENQLHKVWD
jgi:hypothetical protein